MNNSSLNRHLKLFLTDFLPKARMRKGKEMAEALHNLNEFLSEKKEIKEDIKRHSFLLENLKHEHSELTKHQHSIESNELLIQSNNLTEERQKVKAKIKAIFAEMYYNKALAESTQLKISQQAQEMNLYAVKYPQLKPLFIKVNRQKHVYDKQLLTEIEQLTQGITQLETRLNEEETEQSIAIKAQEIEIKKLKAEIDDLSLKRINIERNKRSKCIQRSVLIDKPLKLISSSSLKKFQKEQEPTSKQFKLNRQLSIEAKTKRKPFSNFIFISTDPFFINLQ